MKTSKTWLMGASLVLPLFGCPGDDGTTDDGGNDTTTSGETGSGSGSASGTDTNPSTTDPPTTSADSDSGGSEDSSGDPPMDCLGIGGPGADGEMCTANGDCMSGVCTIFTDVPINADAVCEPHPADCSTRVTGTIFDFTTFEPVGGADLVVAAALQAATNPTGAMALVSATSAADGRVDSVSDGPISAPLGIVGLSSAPSYFLTATGIASPFDDVSAYAVGTNIHDIWVVPEGDLSDWSDALSADPMVPAEALPLGMEGGVVGLVRDSSNVPVAGATVVGADGGATVRYLQDDGSFNDVETSDVGIFVILQPGLGEDFEVSVGGMPVGGGTAGSAPGAIFTLVVTTD